MNEKKPTFKCLSCLFRRWHNGWVVAAFRGRGSHAGHQEPDPGSQAFGEGTAEGPPALGSGPPGPAGGRGSAELGSATRGTLSGSRQSHQRQSQQAVQALQKETGHLQVS